MTTTFAPPKDAVLVRASGFCALCDSRFRDKLAYEFAAPHLPGGRGYYEARHFQTMSS